MDKLNYRELVQMILKNHVGNRLNSNTEVELILDTERDRYPFPKLELRIEAKGKVACQTKILLISLQ